MISQEYCSIGMMMSHGGGLMMIWRISQFGLADTRKKIENSKHLPVYLYDFIFLVYSMLQLCASNI